MLEFSWDPEKAKTNQKKHGISFEEAQTAFYDDNARIIHYPDHSKEEDRFILLGMSVKRRALIICHCYRDGDKIIRIISARKATGAERKEYEELLP